MMSGDTYVGRRALDVFDPEDIAEETFAIRNRQIKAAVRAYELQLYAFYEPNPAIAARLNEEASVSEKVATELSGMADAILNRRGEEL